MCVCVCVCVCVCACVCVYVCLCSVTYKRLTHEIKNSFRCCLSTNPFAVTALWVVCHCATCVNLYTKLFCTCKILHLKMVDIVFSFC